MLYCAMHFKKKGNRIKIKGELDKFKATAWLSKSTLAHLAPPAMILSYCHQHSIISVAVVGLLSDGLCHYGYLLACCQCPYARLRSLKSIGGDFESSLLKHLRHAL